MNKQSSSNIMTLCQSVFLLALPFLAAQLIPSALGQRDECDPGPWTQAAPVAIDHYGGFMDTDGTFVYEGGGYSASIGDNITQFGRFDPVTNTWTSLADVPDTNNSGAAAVYAPNENRLYVFGGENVSSGTVVDTTRKYDFVFQTWIPGNKMPDVRAFMASCYYRRKIYIVGGYNSASVDPSFGQVWEYDTGSGIWNRTRASMPATLGGPGFGITNGHLYVAGGRNIDNTSLNTLYDYNIIADTWRTRANLPTGTDVPGSAVIGGQLWIFGGGSSSLGLGALPIPSKKGVFSPDTNDIVQIYDPVTDSWTSGPPLNQVRSFAAGAAVGDTAIAVGGYRGSGSTGSVEINVSSCTGGITLKAFVTNHGRNSYAALKWSPSNGGKMNVVRNGSVIGQVDDYGNAMSKLGNHTGRVTYQVCEADTGTCSNEVTVTP